MGKVTLAHEELEKAVERLTALAERISNAQRRLSQQNEALAGRWNGEAGGGFVQSNLSLEMAYSDVLNALMTETDLLQRYHDSMKNTDHNYSVKMGIGTAAGTAMSAFAGKTIQNVLPQ